MSVTRCGSSSAGYLMISVVEIFYLKMSKMTSHSLATILTVSVMLFSASDGFNLDVNNPVMTYGKPDSYFGYSLTVHQNNNANWYVHILHIQIENQFKNKKLLFSNRLLIGAPRELDVYSQFSGAVHQCDKRATGFTCNRTNVFQGIIYLVLPYT